MAIPGLQSLVLLLPELAADRREHFLYEARESLAIGLEGSIEEQIELLSRGRQAAYESHVAWGNPLPPAGRPVQHSGAISKHAEYIADAFTGKIDIDVRGLAGGEVA